MFWTVCLSIVEVALIICAVYWHLMVRGGYKRYPTRYVVKQFDKARANRACSVMLCIADIVFIIYSIIWR